MKVLWPWKCNDFLLITYRFRCNLLLIYKIVTICVTSCSEAWQNRTGTQQPHAWQVVQGKQRGFTLSPLLQTARFSFLCKWSLCFVSLRRSWLQGTVCRVTTSVWGVCVNKQKQRVACLKESVQATECLLRVPVPDFLHSQWREHPCSFSQVVAQRLPEPGKKLRGAPYYPNFRCCTVKSEKVTVFKVLSVACVGSVS